MTSEGRSYRHDYDRSVIRKFEKQTGATIIGSKLERRFKSSPVPTTVYSVDPSKLVHSIYDTYETELFTVEIESTNIKELVYRLDQIGDLKADRDRLAQKMHEFVMKERNLHDFFRDHPDLREKYREVMTLCKLAGLTTSLDID